VCFYRLTVFFWSTLHTLELMFMCTEPHTTAVVFAIVICVHILGVAAAQTAGASAHLIALLRAVGVSLGRTLYT
jgi:hypothetical protein